MINEEIVVLGEKFNTIREVAIKYGLPQHTVHQRWHRGKRDEDLIKPINTRHKKVPVTINEITYESINEAARCMDVGTGSMHYALKIAKERNNTLLVAETERKYRRGQPIEIDGVRYASKCEAADKLGVKYHTFVSRWNKGYYKLPKEIREAPYMITTPIQVGDKMYKSPIHFASVNNISVYAVKQYMDGIWPLDVIMDPVKLAAARQELSNKTRAKNKEAKQKHEALSAKDHKPSAANDTIIETMKNNCKSEEKKLAASIAVNGADTIVDDMINLDGYYQW